MNLLNKLGKPMSHCEKPKRVPELIARLICIGNYSKLFIVKMIPYECFFSFLWGVWCHISWNYKWHRMVRWIVWLSKAIPLGDGIMFTIWNMQVDLFQSCMKIQLWAFSSSIVTVSKVLKGIHSIWAPRVCIELGNRQHLGEKGGKDKAMEVEGKEERLVWRMRRRIGGRGRRMRGQWRRGEVVSYCMVHD